MIRSLVTPQSNDLHIAIPDNYIGKKVEILVFSHDETNREPENEPDIMAQFWGVVSDDTTKKMHEHILQSRAEWEQDI